MDGEDAKYFAERARQERRAAREAADTKAAAMHAELADRYEAVVEAFAALDRARMGHGPGPDSRRRPDMVEPAGRCRTISERQGG